MASVRFDCPSVSLSLKVLLKRTRHALWIGGVLALGVHLMFTRLVGFSEEQKVVKPLTTKFIKRQPRLTKPLEMKRRPQPKRRQIQRKMVAVQAKLSRGRAKSKIQTPLVVRSLAKPQVEVARGQWAASVDLEAVAKAAVIEGSKEAEDVMDMSLEMVDIDALDTGRYHAMVVQDPNDKRNIQGFFYMYVGFSRMGHSQALPGLYYERPSAFPNLMEFMNQRTDIRARFAGHLFFSDDEIMKAPFLYTSVDAHRPGPFEITVSEAENLHNYMKKGGFWFVEDAWPDYGGKSDRTARRMIIDAFAAGGMKKGHDWDYQNIPDEHPVNHSYYDFNAGPPNGLDGFMGSGTLLRRPPYPIEMVVLDGRLWCIMSNKDYEDIWSRECWDNSDPTRQYMFGVNLIVFALTQEGGITHRLMASVQY